MATLTDIINPVWGLSIKGYGVIVQGLASLRQCMELIIRTTQGTDPLRPEFGSRVYRYVDAPENTAIPNIKSEILEALALWETRITVVAISHYLKSNGHIVFELLYRVKDEEIIDRLAIDLQAGLVVSDALNEIILTANFPDNPNNYRYSITLEKNGNNVFPSAPPAGFANTYELFQWVQANWFYIGKFHLLTDKIICYMNAEGVTSASMAISVLPIINFSCLFPQLEPGERYVLSFKENGNPVAPVPPGSFGTPGEVLLYAQSNWPSYDWYIEYLQGDAEGLFSDEFSDEFDVNTTGYRLVGVSHVEGSVYELSITKE